MRKEECLARAQLRANRTGRAHVVVQTQAGTWMYAYEDTYKKHHARKSDKQVLRITPEVRE